MPRPKVLKAFLFFLALSLSSVASAQGADDQVAQVFDIPVNASDLLLSSALEIRHTLMDCSHLVQYVYQRAGLDYDYADSTTLYNGITAFQRVAEPQAGDLIVWRGHAGIVVDPDEHTFVSALRTGVKVSSYVSNYWKKRGIPRFFHYVGENVGIESAAIGIARDPRQAGTGRVIR